MRGDKVKEIKKRKFNFLVSCIITLTFCSGVLLSCSSQPVEEEDLSLDSSSSESATSEESTDELGSDSEQVQQEEAKESTEEDIALDDEQPAESQEKQEQQSEQAQKEEDLLFEEEKSEKQAQQEQQPEQKVEQQEQIVEKDLKDEKQQETLLVDEAQKESKITESTPESSLKSQLVQITNLQFVPNESGGSILISANGVLDYTTRSNPQLKQFIIEIPNAKLPDRLKRNLNTKDIQGEFGAIDAYQNPGSNVARFVIQLREGASEPAVQAEGNTLAIVSSNALPTVATSKSSIQEGVGLDSEAFPSADGKVKTGKEQILASHSLDEYLMGNTEFYGKKISIELNKVPVVDVLKMITEESGINMVIGDGVGGDISLKLRQVPWDQALVIIMKSKKLGYKRQGNILRILPIDEIKKEEEEAAKIAESKKGLDPLVVKVIPLSYAKESVLVPKLKEYLTEKRGKIIGDERTNSIVITDTEASIANITKLISSLDLPPPQVLIEGKIVEAKESFKRSMGVQWSFSGLDTRLTTTAKGPLNMRPNMGFTSQPTGAFNFGLNVGTLDVLGSLNAQLALNEYEDKVKVISSPRIITLSNEAANIEQTTQEPLVSTTALPTGGSGTSITYKDLKLKLDVTPQITADASVIMKVIVLRESKGATTKSSSGEEMFPVNTKRAETRVLVKNGQTAVIGGVYQSDASESQIGVPYLKDIPFFGTLFKGKVTDKGKSELLIFLTPRILGQLDGQSINQQ